MEVYIISNNAQSEYLDTNIHNVSNKDNGTGADNVNFQVESITGKVYSVHLEFSNEKNNIGEEIRESLKKKFIQTKLGSMQTEASAVQSPAKDERSEF